MMAIMLRQLGLGSGHRVLEVGTGTGNNAALIACLVGNQESVVTIDVIPELIEQARGNLTAAGYAGVRVVCGDGAAGAPDYAPYDRIIVTTGTWDFPPQWWTQLRPGGRIVLPLSIRGIQLSVGLDNAGDHLVSGSACLCSFIRMADAMSGPESLIALGPRPGLHAQAVDGPVPEAIALYEALSGPAAEEPTGLWASSIGGGGPGPVAHADRTRSDNGRRAPCDQRNTGHARRQSSRGRHPVIDQHTEDPVAPSGAVLDSIAMARTRTSSSLRQHRPGQRLWVLLHAQFLLRGPATSGDDVRLVEDDYQRMAVLRREGHN
jgi:SAM-dependent methyltransferase